MKNDIDDLRANRRPAAHQRPSLARAIKAALTTVAIGGAAAAPAADSVLEEVIVTARYRAESLQETPIAITAVSGEAIEMKSLGEISEIGAVVPNAYIRRQGTQNGPAPAIGLRGVIQSDFSFSFEPGVAVYIDDVYHGTLLGSSFDLLDLERIEVLRGPQGTLFGKNALGGAIRAVSKKPQGDNTGYLEATYGSFDRMDFKGAYDFSLIEDTLFMRVTALSKTRDGYQDRLDFTCEMIRRGTPQLAGIGDGIGADGSAGGALNGLPDTVPVGSTADNTFSLPSAKPGLDPSDGCKIGSQGGEDVQAARVMFRYIASPSVEFGLAADYTDDHSEVGADDLFEVLSDPNPRLSNAVPGQPTPLGDFYNRTGPTWIPRQTAGAQRGSVLPGYPSYTDLNYGIPFDRRFLTGNPYQTYSTFADAVNGKQFPTEASVEAWGVSASADFRLSEQVSLKLIASQREYTSEFSDDRDHGPLGMQVVYTLAEHEQQTAEVQLSGRAFDRVDWTVGGFYYKGDTFWGGSPQLLDSANGGFTHNDTAEGTNYSGFAHAVVDLGDRMSFTAGLRYTDESKDYHFDHSPAVGPTDASTADTRFDWKAGMDFDITDDILLYGQVATGSRSEAFNVRIFTRAQLANTPIDAEELTSYELGMKGDWFNGTMRLNLAAFYSDYATRVILQSATECPPLSTPILGGLGTGTCPAGTGPATPWFYYINTPAEIRGVEAELTLQPIDGLTIDSTVGWLEFESPDVHKDNLIQPEWNGSIGVQYAISLGNGATITPRTDWFYQGDMTFPSALAVPANDSQIEDAHWWGNVRLTYETADRDWSASLVVTNVADEFFYENRTTASNYKAGVPTRPREWGITFKRSFQ